MADEIILEHLVETGGLSIEQNAGCALRYGLDGKSAYRTALDGGYTGTEEQFCRQLAASALTYLVNLTEPDYQAIARQVATELDNGRPVMLYIRASAGAPFTVATHVRDTPEAYLCSTAQLESATEDGIARLDQVQYLLSKATGNISVVRSKLLASLLTTAAVQDSLDGDAATLPVSQRQAAALKRALTTLDGQALKKDDFLLLNGNGAPTTNKN